MKKLINNFSNNSSIELSAAFHPKCGELVTITQGAGSMRFQHDMTVSQAREMAEALVALADSVDEVTA